MVDSCLPKGNFKYVIKKNDYLKTEPCGLFSFIDMTLLVTSKFPHDPRK
jgi:hypothetical protein